MTKKTVEIEFYDNAESLPIKRFQRFNKFVMIDNEVGSSFEDYDIRTAKALEFLNKSMLPEAIMELENRRQMVFQSYEEYSPKHYALAIMVKSIDGVPTGSDMSEKTLENILEKLNEAGFTQKQVIENVSDLKKKSTTNWSNISLNILKTMRRKTITYFS